MTTEPAASRDETSTLEPRIVFRGLLYAGSDPPLEPGEIVRGIEPLIAEQLEHAAWWPEHELREGWTLGDYSFYVIGFPTRDFKSLYVQFYSEPDREAMLEIIASRNDPEFRTAAPDAMREALACEIAGLMTGCLDYDGRGQIRHQRVFNQVTYPARVFHNLTVGDIERLLRSSGLVIWQLDGQPDVGFRMVRWPRFFVYPYRESPPGSGLYCAIHFSWSVKVEQEAAEEVIKELYPKAFGASLNAANGMLTITYDVLVHGGVTERNLRGHLQLWRGLLDRVAASCRRHVEDG